MKKNLYYSVLLMALTIMIIFTSCGKFKLLKNENMESVMAGENLKTMTIWEFLSANDFHKNDLTKVGLFGQAVEYAGLKDILNSDGNYTVVLFNDDAMKLLFTRLGYTDLRSIPPALIRNALLNNITAKARVRSTDLNTDETRSYATLGTDSLYFNRTTSSDGTDIYVFYVNKSASVNTSTRARVPTQDLEFKNGVAQVVTSFIYYDQPILAADPPPATVVVLKDTVFVAKDSYTVDGANENSNYSTVTDMLSKKSAPGLDRRILMQFPLRQTTFPGRIGSAKLNVYISAISGGKGATVNLYEDDNVDWNEATLTRINSPAFGTTVIGSFTVAATGGTGKFANADITGTYTGGLIARRTFTNIDIYAGPDLLSIRSRESTSGKYKAFISLSSPPVTVLTLVHNTVLSVDLKSGSKFLTKSELQFAGAADKNISYSLQSLPSNGYLTRNGIPIAVNTLFSQDEMQKGTIKYIYSGTAPGTDSFILEAKDYQGGYYNNLVTVPVTIQ